MNACHKTKLSAARVLENYSNACNVMSFLHGSVFTLLIIEGHTVLLHIAIGQFTLSVTVLSFNN